MGIFFRGASESGEHNKLSATKSIASSSVSSVMEKSVTCDETLKAEILWALKAIMSHYSYKSCKVWRGKLDKNGIEWIYIKPRDALYRTMWWHTQQNNKLLGGQIYHTRYIVLLYRTCPYIVPYAAISCLVLPNCHQCAAIECKSSHKIVPYAAISYSMKLYFERSAMLP